LAPMGLVPVIPVICLQITYAVPQGK